MTSRQLSQRIGVSPQAVRKWWAAQPAEQRQQWERAGLAQQLVGRGGAAWDFDPQILPKDWQQRLEFSPEPAAPPREGGMAAGSPRRKAPAEGTPAGATCQGGGNLPGQPTPTPTALVPLFAELAVPVEVETQAAALHDPGKQQLALERYRIIEPLLNGGWKQFLGQRLASGKQIRTKDDAIQWLAAQRGHSSRTLWRWRQRFEKQGLVGLLNTERSDKGTPRSLSAQDRTELARLYTTGDATIGNARACWREFCRQKRRISYGVVKSFLHTSIPAAVRDRAVLGAKAFNDRHLPYIQRSYDRLGPNDIWVGDHCQLDFFVTAWGRAARPWLTAFMDMKSRRITGWTLSLQPDSLTIASALRMGLEECGLPQALYLDNGKDFRSRYLGGRTRRLAPIDLPDEARGLLDELGVAVICATPFHPQAKSIERFFRTMHVQFDAAFPSYCGQRPGKRPETCQPLLDEHRDCLQRGVPEASPLPSIEETALTLALWLQEEYHQQPHRGRGMRGRTPAEVYEPSDRRINPGKLALLLLKRERRQVDRGAVTLFGRRYEAEGNALFFHNSHTAQVCYDPHNRVFADLREVLVVCCGQAFHCRHFGEPETYEDLRQRLRARRRLTKLTERCLAELDRRASIASPGERRRLAVAAALPAGIDPRTPDRAQLAAPVTPPVLSEAEGSAAERPLPETPGVAQPDYGAAARRVFTSYTEADDDAGS